MTVRITLFNTGTALLILAVGIAIGMYVEERMGAGMLAGVFAAAGAAFGSAVWAMRAKNRRELAELDRLLEKRNADWRPPQ